MRKFLLFSMLMVCSLLAAAQTRTITGQIKDSKGDPVPFVTIKIKGSESGTTADAEGKFSIQAATGTVLIISAANITTQEVTVGEQSVMAIEVKRSQSNLDEVVVTALGIKRKPKELGYASATLAPTQITAGKSFNLAQALSGKVSGLTISNTSAAVNATPRIVLRGLRSITGDNTALIVLDGVPVPPSTINYINPNDVENLTVLKGGQAATLFGSDGVNGAIVITTKKGSRKPEVSITHSSNAEQVSFLPKTQHSFGSGSAYGANVDENFFPAENQQYGPHYDGSTRPLGRALPDGSIQMLPYSDISDVRKKIWNTGYTAQTDVAYRAGDENSNFYMSFQNVSSNGIVPKDTYLKNSLRMNAGRSYGKVKLSFDATYNWDHADRTNSDFYFFSLNTPSWAPLDQYKDWQNNPFANPNGYFNDYYNNPWWQLDNNRWDTKSSFFTGNLLATVQATKNLDISYRLAVSNANTSTLTTGNKFVYSTWAKNNAYLSNYIQNYDYLLVGTGYNRARTPVDGSVADGSTTASRVNSDLYATFTKDFNKFTFRAIIGNNIQFRTDRNVSTRTASIAVGGLYNFDNSGSGLFTATNTRFQRRKVGNYADVTLGFNNYLFAHGVFRYDMSSVFYLKGRSNSMYGFAYYGGDLSVIVSDIIPSIKSDWLNYLKIRGGWNRNGNDNLDPSSLITTYPTATGFPYSGLLGSTVGDATIAEDLKPEIVNSNEIGAEVSLWNSRISLEVNHYRQRARNQILNVTVSSASGFKSYLLNAADVTNKGWEFDGKANLFRNRDWSVNINANYTYATNVVNQLFAANGLNSLQYQGDALVSLNAEVGQMFPYLKTTAWQRDAQGRVIVDPDNGWPLRATSMSGQGSTTPKHIFGVGLNVSFKNFTLVADAEYRGDFVVYHDLGTDMAFTGSSALTTLYNRDQFIWPNSVYYDGTKYVPNTDIAVDMYKAMYQGWGDLSFSNGYNGTGEVFVSSGSFWKLRDVALTYDVPNAILTKIKAFKGISLTVWGRNLKTWLAGDNYFTDPEFSNTSGNAQGINTTLNTPPTRQWGGTIKLTF